MNFCEVKKFDIKLIFIFKYRFKIWIKKRNEFLCIFKGYIKKSPLFYGFYDTYQKIGNIEYQLPLAYFLVYLFMLGYSFWAILRKMAANARLSKVTSGKAEHYTFTWKVFCSWDYTIGNPETATNTVASNANKMRVCYLAYI